MRAHHLKMFTLCKYLFICLSIDYHILIRSFIVRPGPQPDGRLPTECNICNILQCLIGRVIFYKDIYVLISHSPHLPPTHLYSYRPYKWLCIILLIRYSSLYATRLYPEETLFLLLLLFCLVYLHLSFEVDSCHFN